MTVYYLMGDCQDLENLACRSVTERGVSEELVWIPVDEVVRYHAVPISIARELKKLPEHLIRIVENIPAAVEIGISSVKTETELPPADVPQTGETLYQALGNEKLANIKEEPPVELSFHVDQGGYGRTAESIQGEALDKAVELLCAIKIGAESGEWVTDNDIAVFLYLYNEKTVI